MYSFLKGVNRHQLYSEIGEITESPYPHGYRALYGRIASFGIYVAAYGFFIGSGLLQGYLTPIIPLISIIGAVFGGLVGSIECMFQTRRLAQKGTSRAWERGAIWFLFMASLFVLPLPDGIFVVCAGLAGASLVGYPFYRRLEIQHKKVVKAGFGFPLTGIEWFESHQTRQKSQS